jgi:glycosyltransferase involved in cell wall biosynthesis
MGSPPARVTFCVSALEPGGIDSVVRALATGLDPERFEVSVFSLGPDLGTGDLYRTAGIPVVAARKPGRMAAIRMAARLPAFLRQKGIRLVHAHPGSASRLMALLAGVPMMVSTYHGSWVGGASRSELWLRRFLDTRSSAVVANSRSTRDHVAADLRLPLEGVQVIYNGVDLTRFHPPSGVERQAARAAFGIGTDEVVLGTVARLYADKGVSDVLLALAGARAQGTCIRMLVVGDGPERPVLEAQAVSLGVAPFVRFLGARSDVGSILRACDLAVLASRTREGFGIALVEAMATGLPVLGTTVEGVPEVVDSGKTGVLVPPSDPAALREALVSLARNPGLRSEIGARARAEVCARFDVRRMVAEYGRLYDCLLDSGRNAVGAAPNSLHGRIDATAGE